MKKTGILSKVVTVLRIAYRFSRQHTSSLEAMNGIYTRQFPEEQLFGSPLVETLEIIPFGSIFSVTRRIHELGDIRHETTWLATYGWHSNGHLIEIGGYRYCIFDPLQRTLYLEKYNDDDLKTIEIFTKK